MPLAHPRVQTIVAPAVDHPFDRDVREPRVGDSVIAESQLADRMRIAVEREDTAGGESAPGQAIVDVLAMPVAIQLDGDAELCRLREHGVPVGRDTRTAVEHPAAGMPEDRNARDPDGVEHPGRLILGLAKHGVRRRDDELELCALLRLQIETPVNEDVRLDPFEDAKASPVFRIHPVDFDPLFRRLLHRNTARDGQTVRVIRDPEARVSKIERPLHHPLDALRPVAPRRMHLKVAAISGLADDGRIPFAGERL